VAKLMPTDGHKLWKEPLLDLGPNCTQKRRTKHDAGQHLHHDLGLTEIFLPQPTDDSATHKDHCELQHETKHQVEVLHWHTELCLGANDSSIGLWCYPHFPGLRAVA
jgi:hypothetical protein